LWWWGGDRLYTTSVRLISRVYTFRINMRMMNYFLI
jgi:hypothetical protein